MPPRLRLITLAPARLALVPAALAAGIGAAALMAAAPEDTPGGAEIAGSLLVGWSFVASGLIAWERRPEIVIGKVMVATGFAWFVHELIWATGALPWTLGQLLEELAYGARLPLEIDVGLSERLPERVEAAAYYVVSEALTNVVKHAEPSAVRVRVQRTDGRAVVEVADDGVGGADGALGSGLRGLADRVDALGGLLRVESPRGRGTVVHAEIPCG